MTSFNLTSYKRDYVSNRNYVSSAISFRCPYCFIKVISVGKYRDPKRPYKMLEIFYLCLFVAPFPIFYK